jgi:gas vesicle protein
MAKNTGKKFAIGALIAAAVGYLAGILTAPKSGKETRQDIKDVTAKSLTEAEAQLKRLHTELNSLLEEAKLKGTNLSEKAQKELNGLVESGKQAKEKARMLLSALHEGEAEDKELSKALAEANKAVEHLKNYLSK